MTLEEHIEQTSHVDAMFYITMTATCLLNAKLSIMFAKHDKKYSGTTKQNYNRFKNSCDGVEKWAEEILKNGYDCCTVDGDNSFVKVFDALHSDANDLIRLWIDVINAEYADQDAPTKITAYARNLCNGKYKINDEVRDYFTHK